MVDMGIISAIAVSKIAKFAIFVSLSNKNCIKSKSAPVICQDSDVVLEVSCVQI